MKYHACGLAYLVKKQFLTRLKENGAGGKVENIVRAGNHIARLASYISQLAKLANVAYTPQNTANN